MFKYEGYPTDQARLRGFIEAVNTFVSSALSTGSWSLIDPPLVTTVGLETEALIPAQEALREFNNQRHVENWLLSIDQVDDSTLQSHGISGKQLQFKLQNVARREQSFRLNQSFGPFRRLIGAIDTLLESILDSVPGGGALKELKDAARDATQDDES